MTRAWVEVDLGALRRNGAAMAARVSGIIPMVKADAYGLGAVPAARALERLDPWGFGVATIEEGVALREAGIRRRLLLFRPALAAELDALRAAGITPTLGDASTIARWTSMGTEAWHLAIDTGMNRAGVPWSEVDALSGAIAAAPPEGAFTHFHSAERDDGSVEQQSSRFAQALSRLPVRPRYLHAENSAALARVERSRWDLGRPGVFLYGVGSGPRALVRPEPVVHVRARIVELRTVPAGETVSYLATYGAAGPRRIATLAIGYADGYRRALSNRGTALVRGRCVPVAGLVTMDMTMLDVTDAPCEVGDVATLIGTDGTESLDVERVAAAADVSPYELLTGLRSRLPRHYRGDDA